MFEIKKKDGLINGLSICMALLLFVISSSYFSTIISKDILSDIPAHAEFAKSFGEGSSNIINFLYYACVYVFAGFSTDINQLITSSIWLLGFAVAFKFLLTVYFSKQYFPNKEFSVKSQLLLLTTVGMLCFCFNFPDSISHNYYLGKFPPNVWHNSTIIFLMPFAIGLFYYSIKLIEEATIRKMCLVLFFLLMNVLIKPSFLLAWIAAFPLMVFREIFLLKKQSLFSNKTAYQLIPLAFCVLGLLSSFIAIFLNNDSSIYANEEKSSVVFRPLYIWYYYVKSIPYALFISLLFPLCFALFYRVKNTDKTSYYFAWLLYFIGVCIFALFAETGHREHHGNFMWQTIVSAYLLFWMCLIFFLKEVKKAPNMNFKNVIVGGAFLLHFVSGIVFMIRYVIRETYY